VNTFGLGLQRAVVIGDFGESSFGRVEEGHGSWSELKKY
jgi:hypothetical protein